MDIGAIMSLSMSMSTSMSMFIHFCAHVHGMFMFMCDFTMLILTDNFQDIDM
jgi:hypothetical protein